MTGNRSRSRSWVQPRWVWAGAGAGVLGLVLLGVAASIRSWWWTGAGALLLVVGAAAARRGRIWRDVQATGRDSGSRDGELERLAREGMISVQTALLYASNPGDLRLTLGDLEE